MSVETSSVLNTPFSRVFLWWRYWGREKEIFQCEIKPWKTWSHIQQQSLMISQFLAICLYEQNLLSLVNPVNDWKTKTEQLSKVKLWKSLLYQFAKITILLNVTMILCLWGLEGSTYFLLHNVTKFHKLMLIILTCRITKTLYKLFFSLSKTHNTISLINHFFITRN